MDTAVNLPVSIRQQRIVDVHSVSVGLGWLIIVPLCLTIIGSVLVLPLMMIFHRISTSSANGRILQEANRTFPEFIGTKAEYLDVAVCGYGSNLKQLSASGMAYAGGRLFVLEEGLAAELPWEMIRSWSWKVEGAGQTKLYGTHDIATHAEVGAANQNAVATAFRQSGFTITTADIEKPEWRFQTNDTAVLKKWMEILTQMDEGRLLRR